MWPIYFQSFSSIYHWTQFQQNWIFFFYSQQHKNIKAQAQWKLKQWGLLMNTLSIRDPTALGSLLTWCWEETWCQLPQKMRDVDFRIQPRSPFFPKQSLSTQTLKNFPVLRWGCWESVGVWSMQNTETRCLTCKTWTGCGMQELAEYAAQPTQRCFWVVLSQDLKWQSFLLAKILVNSQMLNGHWLALYFSYLHPSRTMPIIQKHR